MTQQDENTLVLLPPDPGYVALVGSFIRCLLQILAGAGFTYGAVTDTQIAVVASVVVALATLSWSFWQKIQTKRKARTRVVQAAVMSAATGKPTVATQIDSTC